MSYSQSLKNDNVRRQYSWYISENGGNATVLPSDATKAFYTSSTITDTSIVSKIAIQRGFVGKFVWCKMSVECSGYVPKSTARCIGPVTTATVICTPSFKNTTDNIKVSTQVTVADNEINISYTPSNYGIGDNSTPFNSEVLQTSYFANVTRSYNWCYSSTPNNPPTSSTASGYEWFSSEQTCNIPLSATGKYVYCFVSYGLDDPDYSLQKGYDVKAYTKAVQGTTLTLTLGDYSCNDTRQDLVQYGIHDEITISVESADDGVKTYSGDALKSLGLTNFVWTWKTNDSTPVTVSGATSSNNGLTSTLPLVKGLAGKKLTVSVTAERTGYSASGNKGTAYSTDIKKANVTITIPTPRTDLVYGDNRAIIAQNVTTNDTDITQANIYFSIDTELTDDNYTDGTLGQIPLNTSNLNAFNGSNQINHKLYVYYHGDGDHNASSTSTTFTIARANRNIVVTNGGTELANNASIDVVYGNSETFKYKIESVANDTQSVLIKSDQNNLGGSVTTSGTTKSVVGNTENTLTIGAVSQYLDKDTTITLSSAQTNNYNAISKSFLINTQPRILTIGDSKLDDTTPVYGDSVTVTSGAFSNQGNNDIDANIASVSYQWYEATTINGNGTPVSNANQATYTPTASQADDGKAIYCIVTYTLNTSAKGGNYTLGTTSQTVRTTAVVAKRTMDLTLELSGSLIYGQTITSSATITDNTTNTKNPTT